MTINPAAPAANQARQTPHSVVIEDRKRLTATGILSIVSYDSFTATLETPGGTLAIGGEGLTVSEISVQTGEVKINGHDIFADPQEAKKCVGYLPEIPPLHPELTVREYLDFVAELKGLDKKVKTGIPL